ncbi:MAG: hypothetical protein FWH22_01955 [Fibromonadales bacterium]|nr:hypothetical protein [Fibromonadales bacterium]
MKKILAAALACAVSSFATWDYFPIQDAGKGEARLGVNFDMPAEKFKALSIDADVRFSVIEGLEAAAFFNIPLAAWEDGDSVDDVTGLQQPVLGVRYLLPMGLGVFADLTLPFSVGDHYGDDLDLDAGVQFSTELGSELSIGSEVGIRNLITDGPMDLAIGVEGRYSLGSISPWFGAEFLIGVGDDAADLGINPFLGLTFDISETLDANVGATFGLGDRYGDTPIWINANVVLGF